MTTYCVTAKRWRLGWELVYDGETVTQCETLAEADTQFRDWFETMIGKPPQGDVDIQVNTEA